MVAIMEVFVVLLVVGVGAAVARARVPSINRDLHESHRLIVRRNYERVNAQPPLPDATTAHLDALLEQHKKSA